MLKTIQLLVTLFAVIFWLTVVLFVLFSIVELLRNGWAATDLKEVWHITSLMCYVIGTIIWLGSDDKNMFT